MGTKAGKQYSDWQFGRIRARLLAYYYVEKAKSDSQPKRVSSKPSRKRDDPSWYGFSWLEAAKNIILSSSNALEMPKTYYLDEELGKKAKDPDHKWPVTDNTLQAMHRGEIKYPKGKPSYRKFRRPDDDKLEAIDLFLQAEGYLHPNDLVEPADWPEPEPPVLENDGSFDDLPLQVLKALDGDFRGMNDARPILRESYLSLFLEETKPYHKARLVRSVCKRDPQKSNDQWSHENWRENTVKQMRYWGWLKIFSADQGILTLQATNQNVQFEEVYFLAGSTVEGKLLTALSFLEVDGDDIDSKSPNEVIKILQNEKNVEQDTQDEWNFKRFNEASLTDVLSFNKIEKDAVQMLGFASPGKPQKNMGLLLFISPDQVESIFGDQKGISYAQGENGMEKRDIWGKKIPAFAQVDINTIKEPAELGRRLLWTVVHGYEEDVAKLIAAKVDVNFQDPDTGATALHLAAAIAAKDTVQLLTQVEGIDYLIPDNAGRLPSMIAFDNTNMYEMAETLLAKETEQAAKSAAPEYREMLRPKDFS